MLYSHNRNFSGAIINWLQTFNCQSFIQKGKIMANMDLLLRSLSFIEDNLDSEIKTEDIAQSCYASKSSLEKLFKESVRFSVHDYIIRRRMMKAAKIMIQKPQMSLLDVAVQYGYSSHEAFTRTFNGVWNCNPSEFRERYATKGKVPELFPQITGFYQLEGEKYMRRAVDISEMYDFIRERKNCYVVCADIVHLVPINEISLKAGDLALVETMKRMMDSSNDDDVVFRIGNDEFALITSSEDIKYAETIRNKILSMNEQPFTFEDKKIPLSLYAVITKIEEDALKHQRFGGVFTSLIKAINEEKNKVDGSGN